MDDNRKVVEATFEGVDEWSRVLVKTRRGTVLCDVSCRTKEQVEQNADLSDWHTVTADYGEPISSVSHEIKVVLVNQHQQDDEP